MVMVKKIGIIFPEVTRAGARLTTRPRMLLRLRMRRAVDPHFHKPSRLAQKKLYIYTTILILTRTRSPV